MSVDKKKSVISILEFKSLSGFSAEEIVRMLAKGELPSSFAEDGQLVVDLDTVDYENLRLKSLSDKQSNRLLPQDTTLLEEVISSEILKELDSIVDEALELALSWTNKSTVQDVDCLLYTSPSPRDRTRSRMPSSA